MIDFSKLTNLTNLNLSKNTLWSEDLENLKALKNNMNLTINLSNNVNLSPGSKNKLKAHFGNNVTF